MTQKLSEKEFQLKLAELIRRLSKIPDNEVDAIYEAWDADFMEFVINDCTDHQAEVALDLYELHVDNRRFDHGA